MQTFFLIVTMIMVKEAFLAQTIVTFRFTHLSIVQISSRLLNFIFFLFFSFVVPLLSSLFFPGPSEVQTDFSLAFFFRRSPQLSFPFLLISSAWVNELLVLSEKTQGKFNQRCVYRKC